MVEYLRILLGAHLERAEERGASAVEYGLLVGGIAALVVVLIFALGDQVKELFTDTCTAVEGETTAQC